MSPAIKTMRIEHRSDGWHVLSEDGSKHLGGPYGTKGEAEDRLRQVEGHKSASSTGSSLHAPAPLGEEKKAMSGIRVFTKPFAFGKVRTGVWDQLAKLGEFEKDGPAVFDEQTLLQGMLNFARRKNRLAMDYEHQALNAPLNGMPAPALAYYSCAALVIGGEVKAFDNSKDPSVPRPTSEQLVNPVTSQVEDGLYIYRTEVTPLGEELLPNYQCISPAFATEGTDEQGKPIGLDFLNLAATNTPFLDGMKPIEMTRFGSHPRPNQPKRFSMGMDPDLMKRYGLEEGYDDGDLQAAMKKFAEENDSLRKMVSAGGEGPNKLDPDGDGDVDKLLRKYTDDLEGMKKFTDDAEAMKKFADDLAEMKRFADEAMKKFTDDAEAMKKFKKFADDVDAMSAMTRDELEQKLDSGTGRSNVYEMSKLLGCAPTLQAIKEKVTAMKFTHVDKSELAELKTKLAALEQDKASRDKEKAESEIQAFAKQAIDEGSWDPADIEGLKAFRRSAPKEAQKHIETHKGQWLALKRFTRDGHPVDREGKPMPGRRVNLEASRDDNEVGAELVAEAKALMEKEPKRFTNINAAMDHVFSQRPELYRGARR